MKKKDLHFLMKQLLPVGEEVFLSDQVRFHSYTDLANGVTAWCSDRTVRKI